MDILGKLLIEIWAKYSDVADLTTDDGLRLQ